MDTEALIETLRTRPWERDAETLAFSPAATTMLAPYEAQMLRWLAAHAYTGRGDIVDLGCFLGGSTCCFGDGLAANPTAQNDGGPQLHVFDMFVAPNDAYSLGLIGAGKAPGESVRDLFENATAPYKDLMRVYAGDLMEQRYQGRAVELLFVDIAKTHDLNDAVLRTFFANTIGAGTLVVHQDYNHAWLPWVHITAHVLRPISAYIADVAGSRLVVLTDAPTPEMLSRCIYDATSTQEKLAILEQERDLCENPYSAGQVQLSSAWLAFLELGRDALEARLEHPLLAQDAVAPQAEHMRRSAAGLGSAEGYQRYHRDYFSAQRG